jgi:hypothetical protein
MLLKCRKCRQRDVEFDGVRGLCPTCQLATRTQRRGLSDKVALLIQSKVSPGRVPLPAYLALFVVAAVAATVVEVVRFFAEQTRAHQWAAYLAQGDDYDREALRSAISTVNTTSTLQVLTFLGVLFAYQRWCRAGHANAMTRPDIGLGWIRALPGGTGTVWTFRVWIVSAFAMILLRTASGANRPTNPSSSETAANLDAGYSLFVIANALLLCVFVVQLTSGLIKLLATPAPAPAAIPAQGEQRAAEPTQS